ncbi:hypothetical protein PDENDC454_04304 [Paenibacillus dendritiformis C454]|uniref:YopX protein domain-containing protein n=1 Tax=Paenibacillus dendritiformis C454 TaxID=1131935 RepID=H3SBH5_9BACL|nr:YopX family protein [Paenibacillus dendritiformis]EHQ63658.1 hypothetical protein PDENDC454_04304 [Paenibacillus dendritiformis C454]
MSRPKYKFWDREENVMLGPNLDPERYKIASYNGLALIDMSRQDEDGYDYEMDVEFLQFTGLYDRNGKEIYEGDIVYTPQFDWTGYVVFTGDCQYALKGKTELGNDGYILFTQIYLNECEVIGNIYEHPHLLKGVVEDA